LEKLGGVSKVEDDEDIANEKLFLGEVLIKVSRKLRLEAFCHERKVIAPSDELTRDSSD
jgi:hypothetical protein